MNINIYDALVDIERRIEEILQDFRIIKEQSFYSYESDMDSLEELEAERLTAFEYLVTKEN